MGRWEGGKGGKGGKGEQVIGLSKVPGEVISGRLGAAKGVPCAM